MHGGSHDVRAVVQPHGEIHRVAGRTLEASDTRETWHLGPEHARLLLARSSLLRGRRRDLAESRHDRFWSLDERQVVLGRARQGEKNRPLRSAQVACVRQESQELQGPTQTHRRRQRHL